jgi:fumarylacetoacetase
VTGFGRYELPYGSALLPDGRRRVVVAVRDDVLDLTAAAPALAPQHADLFTDGTLDRFLAAGQPVWQQLRAALLGAVDHLDPSLLLPADAVLQLPFAVADYVDFYSSEHHATNVGRIFRPGGEPLPPSWRSLPIGYHGRAGTVVVSGTPVVRPSGQRRGDDGRVVFGPSTRLDLEAEVGFVVGAPTSSPVTIERFADHVLGVCLVNDWSARDIQAWEYVPLGPFLGKAFATSVSAWVVPFEALGAARIRPPVREPRPLPHLDDDGTEPWGLDLRLEVRLNGTLISQPPFASTYWTGAQQLAHLTSGGATLRTGDLYASGTVSGPQPHERGSLLELSWGGTQPLPLDDGTTRTFLEDGDEVVITATAPGPDGTTVALGEVRGRVLPAR